MNLQILNQQQQILLLQAQPGGGERGRAESSARDRSGTTSRTSPLLRGGEEEGRRERGEEGEGSGDGAIFPGGQSGI